MNKLINLFNFQQIDEHNFNLFYLDYTNKHQCSARLFIRLLSNDTFRLSINHIHEDDFDEVDLIEFDTPNDEIINLIKLLTT